MIESLEDRVLLSADVESLRSRLPVEIAPFGHGGGDEGGEALGEGGGEIEGVESGPPMPLPIETMPAVARDRVPDAARDRRSSLVVEDGAGNSLSSDGEEGTPAYKPASPGGETSPAPEVGPPLPEELPFLPRVPWSPSHVYMGSIAAWESTSIRIPVGPSTKTLTLGLAPGAGSEAFSPRIDQVSLLGRDGEVLSLIRGVSILGEGDSQVLQITLRGAPIGGEIVVRLSSSPAWTSSPSLGFEGATEEGGGDLGGVGDVGDVDVEDPPVDLPPASFELSIQRNEFEGGGGGASPASSYVVGASYAVGIGRSEAVVSIGPLIATTEKIVVPVPGGSVPRGAIPQGAVRRAVAANRDAADGGAVEVYLGPLVSRTAAAMGPALATSGDDPTPSTERVSGAGTDGPRGGGTGLDLAAILASRGRGEGAGEVEGVTDATADPAPTTLRGPGGVPIVVAGLLTGEREPDAEALAAGVRAAVRDAAVPVDLVRPAREETEGEEEVARAGLAGRALGFLVGMGLASGPLYPDLVALARRKLRRGPRPMRKRRVNAGRG